MKMNISKREQFMLFVLSIFAVLAVIYTFVLNPLLSQQQTLKNNYDALDAQKFILDTKSPNLSAMETTLDNRVHEVSSILEVFEAPLHSAQFEQRILTLMTKYDMKVIDSNFTDPEIMAPIALSTLPIELQYTLGDLVKEYKDESSSSMTPPSTLAMVLKSTQSYTVKSSYANYVYFLDAVKDWNTSILISSTAYDVENKEANFTFDVYFVDQLLMDQIAVVTDDITANGTGTAGSNEDPFASSK